MDALESQESIASKMQAKNNQLSSINQQIEDHNFQMREMADERQRYNDNIRLGWRTFSYAYYYYLNFAHTYIQEPIKGRSV